MIKTFAHSLIYTMFYQQKNRFISKEVILLITFLICFSILSAQNITNEYSNFECSRSKQIVIPFSSTDKNLKGKHSIHQIVFYEHRDQFSYWYKLIANEDQLIDCKISPINTTDNYALYIYKYGKEDFCDKVFNDKIKPLKWSSFTNNMHSKETFELLEMQMKVKKNEAYYFCVLNT